MFVSSSHNNVLLTLPSSKFNETKVVQDELTCAPCLNVCTRCQIKTLWLLPEWILVSFQTYIIHRLHRSVRPPSFQEGHRPGISGTDNKHVFHLPSASQ